VLILYLTGNTHPRQYEHMCEVRERENFSPALIRDSLVVPLFARRPHCVGLFCFFWFDPLQVDTYTYDLAANLATLKLYQFHPELVNHSVRAMILLKAMMNLPHNDFTLCMYMIPEVAHQEEPIRMLLCLADLLETCRFPEFWIKAETCRTELLNTIPGFDDVVRKCKCLSV